MNGLGFFGAIFVGGLAGLIATVALRQRRALLHNLLVGLAGSFGGDFVAHRLNIEILPGLASSLVLSTLGAAMMVAAFNLFRRRGQD